MKKERVNTMNIRKEIDLNEPLTSEQKQMLEDLKTRPAQPDQDCPELTDEQLRELRQAPSEVL